MSTVLQLESPDDLRELLDRSSERPVMLFKHSTRCPISAFAKVEFDRYAAAAADRGVDCAMVLVVERRAVSNEIAASLGVVHQSPQAILVREGRAVWHDSHEGVSESALSAAMGAG